MGSALRCRRPCAAQDLRADDPARLRANRREGIRGPRRNCTPPSLELLRSFEGAAVQDIAIECQQAAATFSNDAAVELAHVPGAWWIHRFGGDAGKSTSTRSLALARKPSKPPGCRSRRCRRSGAPSPDRRPKVEQLRAFRGGAGGLESARCSGTGRSGWRSSAPGRRRTSRTVSRFGSSSRPGPGSRGCKCQRGRHPCVHETEWRHNTEAFSIQ
jgi:hypothetical protein